jgi:DNA-binding NarL/FixJ family response regulator
MDEASAILSPPDGPARATSRWALVVEEKPFCGQALTQLAREVAGAQDVQMTGAVAEALRALEARAAAVVVVDLYTIDYDFRGLRSLVARAAAAPVLTLDDRLNLGHARLAREAGARGYVAKTEPAEEMRAALRAVLAGEPRFPADVPAAGRPARAAAGLSARQTDVLRLIALGRSNKEIAEALGITPGTVKLHIHAILKATGARNRTEAALVAGRFIRADQA